MIAITRARIALIRTQPFFAALSLGLRVVERLDIATMATDGVSLFCNLAFVSSLTPDEIEAVLAHEVLHVANGHHLRRQQREPRLWNVACDHAINPILADVGYALPKGALIDNRFKGLSAEAIYRLLEQERAQQGQINSHTNSASDSSRAAAPAPDPTSSDDAPWGEVLDWPGPDSHTAPTPAEIDQAKADLSVQVLQAAQAAKARGSLPGALATLITAIKAPAIDWRQALRAFVSQTTGADFSWVPPSRRYAHAGFLVPSIHQDRVGQLVVAIDTSASVSDAELAQFAAELNAILADTRPEAVTVIQCDTTIQAIDDYGPEDYPVHVAAKGRGGTCVAPVFAHIEDAALSPDCLLYLTDLGVGDFPDAPPPYPVLWVTTDQTTAPWGDVIRLVS